MILVPNEIVWLCQHSSVGAWSGIDLVVAPCIILAESGGNTEAIGKVAGDKYANRDLGLGQISNKWHGEKLARLNWRDPVDNIRLMREVWEERRAHEADGNGWKAWATFNNRAWEAHLPAIEIALKFPFAPIMFA